MTSYSTLCIFAFNFFLNNMHVNDAMNTFSLWCYLYFLSRIQFQLKQLLQSFPIKHSFYLKSNLLLKKYTL